MITFILWAYFLVCSFQYLFASVSKCLFTGVFFIIFLQLSSMASGVIGTIQVKTCFYDIVTHIQKLAGLRILFTHCVAKKTSNVHGISFLCPFCLLFGGCITSTFVIGSKLTCILWWWTLHQISAIWLTFWEVWQNEKKKKSKDGEKNVLFICQVPVETIGPVYFDYVSLGPVYHVYNVTFRGFYAYCFFTGRFVYV